VSIVVGKIIVDAIRSMGSWSVRDKRMSWTIINRIAKPMELVKVVAAIAAAATLKLSL